MALGARPIGSRGLGDSTGETITVAASTPGDLGAATSAWASTIASTPINTGVVVLPAATTAWASTVATLAVGKQAALGLGGDSVWLFTADGRPNVSTPVVAPPADIDFRKVNIERVWETFPVPTIADGRPQNWNPTVNRLDWGRYQIVVNGEDVTFFRDKLSIIDGWDHSEPYSDESCVLVFPQLTIYEARGTGDRTWAVDEADVQIRRVRPDGTAPDSDILFDGIITSWEIRGIHYVAGAIGILRQPEMFVRAQDISDRPQDIGELVAFNFWQGSRPSYRFQSMAPIVTGFTSRDHGKWDPSVLQFTSRMLKRSMATDGTQYTVENENPRRPVMRKKNTTTVHYSVTAGSRHVELELQRETGLTKNVFYARGVDAGGVSWRNSYPLSTTAVFYQPLAYQPNVHGTDEDGAGGLIAVPSRVDPSVMRKEVFVEMGSGISITEAKRILEGERIRQLDPGWVGTIRLTADPEECHRSEIRAGKNIRVRHFDGTGVAGQLFHITNVSVRNPQGACVVELTVDTKARDADVVTALLERLAEAANPLQKLMVGRESAITPDATIPWDGENGSGWVPRERRWDFTQAIACPAQQWTFVRFLAAEEVDIWKTFFQTCPETQYHVSIYNMPPRGMPPPYDLWSGIPVAAGGVPAHPLKEGAWHPDTQPVPDGQIMAWGSFGQAAGHSPGLEQNPDGTSSPVSGLLIDETAWTVTHQGVTEADGRFPAFLWIGIWPMAATYFGGFITPGTE